MKLCVNCVWHQEAQAGFLTVHRCMHPEASNQDPVTGKGYQYECFLFRGEGPNNCGPEAKFYGEDK